MACLPKSKWLKALAIELEWSMQGIPAVGARWIYWGLTLVALAASSAAIVRHALPLWYELIALALGSTGHQAACGILTRPARALLPPAAATAQFAKDTGKSCGDCHTNPQGGGPLTPYGDAFKANGNKLPK